MQTPLQYDATMLVDLAPGRDTRICKELLRKVRHSILGPSFSQPSLAARPLCTLRKTDGNREDSFFAKQQREALDKLKATLAAKKKPIDEADEKIRLQKIIERVNVRMEM